MQDTLRSTAAKPSRPGLSKITNRSQSLAIYGILAIGLAAWGGLLINGDEFFWDDWVLSAQPKENVFALMTGLGFWFAGVTHYVLMFFGHYAYRIVGFLSTLSVAILFFKILVRFGGFSVGRAFLIGALAVSFPVNPARISAINVPSLMCFAIFMLGWYLALISFERRSWWLRAAALFLFFLSFMAQSLLLFFLLPLAHLFWLNVKTSPFSVKTLLKASFNWVFRHIDFLFLPVISFAISKLTRTEIASYANLNEITGDGLFAGIAKSFKNLKQSFIEPITWSISNTPSALIVVGLIFCGFLYWRYRRSIRIGLNLKNALTIAIGLLTFMMAVYPYTVVDKIPTLRDWDSRHQLLVSVPAALLLFGLIRSISFNSPELTRYLCAGFIAMFVWTDFRVLGDYRKDWAKQTAIIQDLKENNDIRAAKGAMIVFIDNTPDLNAQSRQYRFYELSGLLSRAYGDQTRFGVLQEHCHYAANYKEFQYRGDPMHGGYSIDGYSGGPAAGVVEINRGDKESPVRLRFIPAKDAKLPSACTSSAS